MNSAPISPWFWSSDVALWNYGDALSVFIVDELIYDFFPYKANTHIIGSVIFDGILANYVDDKVFNQSLYDDRDVKAVFWGCGIRNPGSLSSALYSSVEFLAVRGPVSASDLRLGGTVPQGDPALLLPALYSPRRSAKFVNKSICVPHYNDNRTDDDILRISGCDIVLRPAVRKDKASIKAFIDAVCSAKFVLAGAMHAAVTAAAYGIPFGFWDSGAIDIPTKWDDAAALLNIPCEFFEEIDAATKYYNQEITASISLPSLWPLLCVAPGFLKMSGVLKILKYELETSAGRKYDELNHYIEEASLLTSHHDRIARLAKNMVKHATDLAEDMRKNHDRQIAQEVEAREILQTELTQLRTETALAQEKFDQDRTAMERQLEEAVAAAAEEQQRLEAVRETLEQEVAAIERTLEQERTQTVGRLDALASEIAKLDQDKDELQTRLDAATLQLQRYKDTQNMNEERLAALAEEKNQLETMSNELISERDELKRLAKENGDLIDALNQEVSSLSEGMEEQRRQFDRKLQNLAMEHDQQMSSQHQAYKTLEDDVSRLHEDMMRIITESAGRERSMISEFDAMQQMLKQEVVLLGEAKAMTEVLNLELNQDVEALKERLGVADGESESRRQQISHLQAELHHMRAQADSLREQARTLEAQQLALRANFALTESESVAKTARTDAALSRYWKLLEDRSAEIKRPVLFVNRLKSKTKSDVMREHRNIIGQFLDGFSETELGFSKAGRDQRITQYLLGISPEVEDFPIFNRDIYLFMNPDVAEAGLEAFVHFIRHGQWEHRILHPVMDVPYYVSKYPEADKFTISAVGHYFKFGVSKKYDPSPLFSTKWYFDQYPDVKYSGINPIIHYLRFPGCRPHPDFDSEYYRKNNLDVVRNGVNPLAHYMLWGRDEGRPATADVSPSISQVAVEIEPPDPFPASEPEIALEQTHAPPPVGVKPLVVMMDAFYPRPDEDSGSLDQVNFIRIFQNLGYDVAFIALLNFGDAPDAGSSVAVLGAHCVTASEFSSVEEFLFLNQERISVAFLSRVHFGGAWIERVRAFCPKAKILFNTVDLHHVREERAATLIGDVVGIERAHETKKLEYACINAADVSIVVSDEEQKLLCQDLPSARVSVVPLIREIPRTNFPGWHLRRDLAFVGGFRHQPNIDAVNYFLDDIWPVMRARRPDLIFKVIGSHLPEALKKRADRNVEWVGYVPEIEPWLDKVRLTVAPLRYGAGAKGKVVSSLLNGVPCVATAVAAEGMGLQIGEDIVACQNPEEFAAAIIRVHDNMAVWKALSEKGFATISRIYSLEYGQVCLKAALNI